MDKDIETIYPLTEQEGREDDPEGLIVIPAVDVTSMERDGKRKEDILDTAAQSTGKRKNEIGIPLTAVAARIASAGKTMKKITEAMGVALQTEKTEDIDIDYSTATLDDAMLTIDEEEEEKVFNEVVEELGGSVEEPALEAEKPAQETEKPERLGNPLTLEEIFTGARDDKEEDKEGKTDKDRFDGIDR